MFQRKNCPLFVEEVSVRDKKESQWTIFRIKTIKVGVKKKKKKLESPLGNKRQKECWVNRKILGFCIAQKNNNKTIQNTEVGEKYKKIKKCESEIS